MDKSDASENHRVLRLLPSVDEVLGTEAGRKMVSEIGRKRTTSLAREAVESVRSEIRITDNRKIFTGENLLAETEAKLHNAGNNEKNSGLRRVINATGVIIHTNLGRAPLSENAKRAVFEEASGYCHLEYDVETGKRGRRGASAEKLLAEICGAESALIVNNCAAAALLVLSVFAHGREVVVSRGELVEIGGDFRVPDVLTQSGATLREVGTTNRTKLSDYEKAIGDNTALVLRVHPSNYRITGFTEKPSITELADLAHQNRILLYEDAGSGAIFDMSEYGLVDEPVISRSIAAGADIVTFSGDKLLGGPQSGLIAGRRDMIEQLRKHPLYRALRVDKMIYAALGATIKSYLQETALTEIPVLSMLSADTHNLAERTRTFAKSLLKAIGTNSDLAVEIIAGSSVVGGGAAPDVRRETMLLALMHGRLSGNELEKSLRMSNPPVIARIMENRVLVDLRTVSESEEVELLEILRQII
ncbi:MAG: L-seryl-tRNA(Sec) selenium transferase [Acidobacteriota bacterium]|nr:L-seryl-tRNA(Sec) selenium transferase [Acidobacteriota bacterium]